MKPFYLTTSIVYPNANPHIGYALELVQADFLARYYRDQGRELYFLTGVDEHGLKLQRAAEAEGKTPRAFVDDKATVFRRLLEVLDISSDRFIRTTDPDHEAMAQAIWRACAANGDIYKKKYRAWYNVKEEEFLGLADEVDDPAWFGIDPRFIELIDEENYFFRLSKYKDRLVELLERSEYKVLPKGRLQEMLNFVKEKGLSDISVSREASKLSWGIPVPDDASQVMYVWFDALTNYLTAAATVDGRGDIQVDEKWPADLHCVGKDIHRFHALIWPGMLLSAGLPLPKELLVHGFFTSGGQKMSKSIGNVVDPFAEVSRFGKEAVRWFLLKETPMTGDADYTSERVQQVMEADLANDLGNLVSRVWTMCQKYCQGAVPESSVPVPLEKEWEAYHLLVEERRVDEALKVAHGVLAACNKRIDEEKPWVLAKDPSQQARLHDLLYALLENIRQVTAMLRPALPDTAKRIEQELFAGHNLNESLVPGALGSEPIILFPKERHD
ncbi:methionine--tRNA ligase [Patescibacteria group bacterium]|nr:methionine--tRNA ligase [Patescibacteria group bacterium]